MLNLADGWRFCPRVNIAGKAFVERWIELFNKLTIDNHRVRHLNVRIGFEELRRVIQDAEDKLIENINVKYVSEEVLDLLKNDPIAKQLLPHHEHYYPTLSSPFVGEQSQAKAIHRGLIVLTEQACVVLGAHYRGALIRALTDAVEQDDVEKSLMVTSLLGSDLLDAGFDVRYLRNKGMSFVQGRIRPFQNRFDELARQITTGQAEQFLVAYRIDFASDQDASACPAVIAGLNIRSADTIAADDARLNRDIPGPNVRLATCSIPALDLFAASRKGSTNFYRALDMLQFAKPSLQIVSHKYAYVASPRQVTRVQMPLELLGPIRVAADQVEERTAQLSTIVTRLQDESTIHRVSLGLQYLRRGISDSAPQGQFLNYWIGLEAIAGGKERTDIRNIRTVVPILLALGHPRRLIRDLYLNCDRLQVPLDDVIADNTTELSNHLGKVEAFWRGLVDNTQRRRIEALAAASPLLVSRIAHTANLFGTGTMTKQTVETHRREIEWHIQRLYRVRNAIVHGGPEPGDLTHLASHLATYLWAVLRSMLDDLSSGPPSNDIDKFFNKHQWIYERVLNRAEAQRAQAPPCALLLEPTMIWPRDSAV
jgi:hypothetical protein